MKFRNGISLVEILDKDVIVRVEFFRDQTFGPITGCKVFAGRDGLYIDFAPKLNHQYVAPLPDDAVIERDEASGGDGRIAVFLPAGSSAWTIASHLLIEKKRQRRDY